MTPRIRFRLICLTLAALAAAPLGAAADRVYLEVSPDGTDDLLTLLDDLDQALLADEPQSEPVVVVLHGPEAEPFIRSNYLDNRALIDRAARLQAFDRLDLRMCESWMERNGLDRGDLLPFVRPIPYAPEEVERLRAEGFRPYVKHRL
jgi:intracellular sulfur oxidation DsrE/DsrF family protein